MRTLITVVALLLTLLSAGVVQRLAAPPAPMIAFEKPMDG